MGVACYQCIQRHLIIKYVTSGDHRNLLDVHNMHKSGSIFKRKSVSVLPVSGRDEVVGYTREDLC